MNHLVYQNIILASGSPRRKSLLTSLGYNPVVHTADIDESAHHEFPAALVKRLSLQKAMAVREKIQFNIEENELKQLPILAADTIVCYKNLILGKPKDRQEAVKTLNLLSGKTHAVKTGFTLILPSQKNQKEKVITKVVTTFVKFRNLNSTEIESYLELNEWQDAAGGYKIQEQGKILVAKVWGSITNVIGLPIEAVSRYLK